MPEGHTEFGQEAFVHDLEIAVCRDCRMTQSLLDLDLIEYYQNYGYSLGHSPHMKRYAAAFADALKTFIPNTDTSLVVEVGSGDGEQLLRIKQAGFGVCGIEPSKSLVEKAQEKGVPSICEEFNSASVNEIVEQFGKADSLIIQYTFDHLQSPREFMQNADRLLKPNGTIVIEVHDFEKIVARNEACLFTHEHAVYPSFTSLSNLMAAFDFKIIGHNFLPDEFMRGNSFLTVAARKTNRKPALSHKSTLLQELDTDQRYVEFTESVRTAHDRLKKFVVDSTKSGLKVAGYGAAGRGVDTLVLAKLNASHISVIFDKNPLFHGKYTPVSGIPVQPPEQALEECYDILLVFSYGYIDEVREFYKDRPMQIISLLDIIEDSSDV